MLQSIFASTVHIVVCLALQYFLSTVHYSVLSCVAAYKYVDLLVCGVTLRGIWGAFQTGAKPVTFVVALHACVGGKGNCHQFWCTACIQCAKNGQPYVYATNVWWCKVHSRSGHMYSVCMCAKHVTPLVKGSFCVLYQDA